MNIISDVWVFIINEKKDINANLIISKKRIPSVKKLIDTPLNQ